MGYRIIKRIVGDPVAEVGVGRARTIGELQLGDIGWRGDGIKDDLLPVIFLQVAKGISDLIADSID